MGLSMQSGVSIRVQLGLKYFIALDTMLTVVAGNTGQDIDQTRQRVLVGPE